MSIEEENRWAIFSASDDYVSLAMRGSNLRQKSLQSRRSPKNLGSLSSSSFEHDTLMEEVPLMREVAETGVAASTSLSSQLSRLSRRGEISSLRLTNSV